jgi:outer membrane receptor protein involved in Fe transport
MHSFGARSLGPAGVRASIALALAMAFSPVLAQAQTSEEQEEAEARAAEADLELERVFVTGSRIPRAGFDTLEPASVVTREYIDSRGITNVADAINEIPGFGVGVTPEGGQSSFGVGVNFVNRFGLGTARTLTVINGRRFVSANTPTIFGPAGAGLQVDLNQIPTSMIERVENVAIGGAPTYGSDAIAGTVNIILRRNFEGLDVGANYGISQESDNQRWGASVVWGRNFANDRANLTLGLTVDTSDGVLQSDRRIFSRALTFQPNPNANLMAALQPNRRPETDGRFNPRIPFNTGPTDGVPDNVLIRDGRIFSTPPAGLALPLGFPFTQDGRLRGFGPDGNTLLVFDPNGNLVPYDPGNNFGLVWASGGDGFKLFETGQVISDLDRATFNVLGSYELNDSMRLFYEGVYYRAESLELVAQPIYNSPLFGGLSSSIIVQATHPLLTPQAASTLQGLGVERFALSRAGRDLVENNAEAEMATWRHVVGLDGGFTLGNRDFNWEVTANMGRYTASFFRTELNQQNFINAINVVRDASGNVRCDPNAGSADYAAPIGPRPTADPNCVPLDIFGEGRPSAAARAYVTERTRARTTIEQSVFNANVTSTLVELWSGPVDYNIGIERRIEKADFTPDAFSIAGRGRAVPIIPNAGSFGTKEVFFETVVPLVNRDADMLLLKRLDVTGKYRRVDNTVNGSFNTYTYGLQWKPFDDLEFRGNFTRSLRAPAVTELFTPTSDIFTFVPDPCDTRNVNSGTRPDVRRRNCEAFYRQFGLDPNNFTSIAVSATIRGTTGGDPNLLNESADAYTWGLVWQPSFIENFVFAADYYKIEIDGVIANLNAAALATGCFDNENFDASDVNNANQFCQRIVRLPNGQIESVRTGFVNGSYLNFTGASSEMRYRVPTDRAGTFELSANWFWLKRLVSSVNGVVETDSRGQIGNSSRQAQYNLNWTGQKWGTNLSLNYIGPAVFSNTDGPETRDFPRINGYWLTNVGLSYRIGSSGIVRLAVTNAFNREPPFPTTGIGVYDILGRRYSLMGQWSF